jgi:hypothetical protein
VSWKGNKIIYREFEFVPNYYRYFYLFPLNTTRNYLICNTFSATFSENITKITVSTTYSCFSSRMCTDVYWSPEHYGLRRIPVFRHGCALMDIQDQNTLTYSCFSSRMCADLYSSPEHCDDLINSSQSSPQHCDILADSSRSIITNSYVMNGKKMKNNLKTSTNKK